MRKHAVAVAIALRIVLFLGPLCLLWLFAQRAFEHASRQEHRGDTGLGIAIVLGMVTLTMLAGFSIDFIVQAIRKRAVNALTDALILLILLMPFGWFACNWFGLGEHAVCRLPMDGFGIVLEWLER